MAHHKAPELGHVVNPYNQNECLTIGAILSPIFFLLHVYFRIRYNIPMKNDEFGARILSFIHAAVSCPLAFYALFTHTGATWDAPATRAEANVAMFSLSYFAVDTIIMFIWKFDAQYVAHHVLTVTACTFAAIFGNYGVCVCMAIFIGELSNPFMHMRWLLGASGNRNAAVTKWMTILFFVTFVFARVVIGPWTIVNMMAAMPIFMTPMLALIWVFSWLFLYNVTKAEWNGEWWEG